MTAKTSAHSVAETGTLGRNIAFVAVVVYALIVGSGITKIL